MNTVFQKVKVVMRTMRLDLSIYQIKQLNLSEESKPVAFRKTNKKLIKLLEI